MSKFVYLLLIFCILISSISVAKEFSDIPASHWAYTYIDELSNKGVINGYEDGSFNPTGTITKAEYIKLLISNLLPKDTLKQLLVEQKNYDNWFEPYIKIVKEKNIITENYTNDELKETVARREMATLIVQFSNYVGLKPVISNDDSFSFKDLSSITYGEQKAIIKAYELGLVNGYEDGTFMPDNIMTRAEVATIVYRFADAYAHKDDEPIEAEPTASGDIEKLASSDSSGDSSGEK